MNRIDRWFASGSLILWLMLLFLVMACSRQQRPDPDESRDPASRGLQTVYVDSLPAGLSKSGQPVVEIEISGNLPDPSYRFQKVEVVVEGDVIELTPLATRNPKLTVTQVLVPFRERVEITGLKPGTYRLRVIGRGRTQETKLKIE